MAKIDTDSKKITELITRGIEDVFVKESVEKKLQSGKQMRVKFGIDPTGPKIHLGRAAVLRKLRMFQDMGHQIVLIVGDFTALIGDPSDKLEKRPMLTPEKIQDNLRQYKETLGKVIDVYKVEFVYNSEWLSKLNFSEIAILAESFSVQQMSSRRNFKDRFDRGEEVSLREFLYPLMQGYDSVAVKADIEIGGFDQLFNLKAGRIIQKHYAMPEQDVLTVQMLEGTDGRKMSTSWGNVINVTDEANDMFGKVMSLKDSLIPKYFLLCTDVSMEKVKKVEAELALGEINPRDLKAELAKEIVALYHGKDAAVKAEENFINTFKKGGVPDDVKETRVSKGTLLSEVLLAEKLVSSKTDFKRLIKEGAISEVGSGTKITEEKAILEEDVDIKIGKQRFIKVRIS